MLVNEVLIMRVGILSIKWDYVLKIKVTLKKPLINQIVKKVNHQYGLGTNH